MNKKIAYKAFARLITDDQKIFFIDANSFSDAVEIIEREVADLKCIESLELADQYSILY